MLLVSFACNKCSFRIGAYVIGLDQISLFCPRIRYICILFLSKNNNTIITGKVQYIYSVRAIRIPLNVV